MKIKRTELIVILGALIAFAPMSIDMYLPALPTLEQHFAATTAQVQITLATFFFGFALGQAGFGPVMDRYGRKKPLYVGLALFVVASAGCAVAPSIESLTILRLFQAIGACAGGVASRAMVRDLFEPQEAARVFSHLLMVMALAPILAPPLGGQLLVHFGWPSIFWFKAAVGVIALFGVWSRLPDTHKKEAIRPLALGAALSTYGNLLRHRLYLGYALSSGFAMAGMFAYIAGSPFAFMQLHGVTPAAYGWLFGINACGFVVASRINLRLLRRFQAGTILGKAIAAQAIAAAALLVSAATNLTGLVGLLIPVFVYVSCIGFVVPNATAMAMAPHGKVAGAASAMIGTLQFTLAASAATLAGAIHDGTAAPMAGVILLCSLMALAAKAFLVGRTSGQEIAAPQH